MEDFLEGFEEVNKGPQIVANESTKARNNERVDIRYSKNIATVTSAAKVTDYKVKQWPTLDSDSLTGTNALGISIDMVERRRAIINHQKELERRQAEQVEISKAHEILDEELEAEQSVAQPQVTVEELEQIRKDAFEEGKTQGYEEGKKQGYDDGYNEGNTKGHQEGLEQGRQEGYQEGLAQGNEDGFLQGHNEGVESGQKVVLEQVERFRYLADALANPLRQVDKDVTDEIAYIISRLVKVITKKEIAKNADFLVKSIEKAISILPNAKKGATIYLNPDDLSVVQAALGSEYMQQQHYQLVEDPALEVGDVKVSNEESLIDWRIDDRIDALLNDFLTSVYPCVQKALKEPIEGCPDYDAPLKKKKSVTSMEDLQASLQAKLQAQQSQEQEVQEVASQEEAVALDPNQDQNIETIDPANAVDKNSGA
ncbi:MAG: flagellar assembly protein FliH [Succinivibrio sp.]|jgi:flagellar biosynthesis/type III secretory pathway protein FliH|nr:flagellar assembly protein FliH [Succinivibrio sp.]